MKLRLAYGRSVQEATLPPGRFETILPPPEAPGIDVGAMLTRALDNPIGMPALSAFLRNRPNLLIVVSDATRRTGAEQILPALENYLAQHGLAPQSIKIVVATGIHRPPTGDELSRLTGKGAFPRAERLFHCATGLDGQVELGTTSFGNRVVLNGLVAWADAVLVCGAVGFHYFAGFSGGRKSIMPGLAAEETIRFNHRLVLAPDGSGRNPRSATARLSGNPVHEDMEEALRMVGLDKVFLINTTLSREGWVNALVAGQAIDSHREACRHYLDSHFVPLPEPADVLIAGSGGYPRDINMIQSHKIIEMARHGLREGGILVVAASCEEGMGHPDFFPWFRFADPASFCRELANHYLVNGQTALALFEKAFRYRILLVSALPPADVAKMGLVPFPSLQAAVDYALSQLPADFRGVILPEAGQTYCGSLPEQAVL